MLAHTHVHAYTFTRIVCVSAAREHVRACIRMCMHTSTSVWLLRCKLFSVLYFHAHATLVTLRPTRAHPIKCAQAFLELLATRRRLYRERCRQAGAVDVLLQMEENGQASVVCLYTYIRVCMYMCIYIFIYIHIYVYSCIYINIHVYAYMNIYIYISIYICICCR